jgi:Zn finger protein HypA/HybF involved in hydrogenase expression
MKDDLYTHQHRTRVDSTSDDQPTIVGAWLRQIVHRLVAQSPRMICTRCNEEFFAAEIKVKISRDGVREECPNCQADSFRIAPAETTEPSEH